MRWPLPDLMPSPGRGFAALASMLAAWAMVVSMLLPAAAHAHQSGNSYLRIASTSEALQVQLDFAVRDIDSLLQIPEAERRPLQRDDLPALGERLSALVQESLQLEADGSPVALRFHAQDVVLHNDGLYVRQHHTATALPADAAQLLVRYGFFNDEEKVARAFVKLNAGGQEQSFVFDARHAVQRLPLREVALVELLWTYVREGALHIWGGPDHLLFLLCLLLPGLVLAREQPAALGRYALTVVTAFTVAHSITLAAAALDWVVLPDRWIEACIAASIIVSAVLNLLSGRRGHQWKLAFGFGLIHGLGFANGLRELGLSSSHFIETLLAFNLGVEAGQLLVLLVVGLLLWPLLRQPALVGRLQRWGSVSIGVIAAVWLVERLA